MRIPKGLLLMTKVETRTVRSRVLSPQGQDASGRAGPEWGDGEQSLVFWVGNRGGRERCLKRILRNFHSVCLVEMFSLVYGGHTGFISFIQGRGRCKGLGASTCDMRVSCKVIFQQNKDVDIINEIQMIKQFLLSSNGGIYMCMCVYVCVCIYISHNNFSIYR